MEFELKDQSKDKNGIGITVSDEVYEKIILIKNMSNKSRSNICLFLVNQGINELLLDVTNKHNFKNNLQNGTING